MPRKPRIHVPGGFYHVMQRGNGGQDIFLNPTDGRRYLDLLADAAGKFGMRTHGYCLMPNHLHLILQAGAAPLSQVMQSVSQRYTGRINTREKRAGHLFQGRYKAVLVDADSYLLELVRYVHLNPVRAGLAKTPEAWRWSSHRGYLGREAMPLLTTGEVLGRFAKREAAARKAYRAFIADGMGAPVPDRFRITAGADGRVLGDDGFIEAALGQAELGAAGREKPPAMAAIIDAVTRAYGVSRNDLTGPSRVRVLSEARGVAVLLARKTGAATPAALAALLGRDASGLGRIAQHLSPRAAEDSRLAQRIDKLNNSISRA